MYNLIVNLPDGQADGERVLEATDEAVLAYAAPDGRVDTSRLVNLPTLVMPEIGADERQTARVGHIENLTQRGRYLRFRFVPNPALPEIALARIESAAFSLGIYKGEFTRTHWAVKDVDLYRVVQEEVVAPVLRPTVFRFPIERPQQPDLVAVMMPFAPQFTPTFEALRQAAADAGLQCRRADDNDIWKNERVMDDVVDLIWDAQVVISDFTGMNPNVFYETGIAHSLGRRVLPIAQSVGDVPFDLNSFRTLQYLANGEGFETLRKKVAEKLQDLTVNSRT